MNNTFINNSVDAFRALLISQLDRAAAIENAAAPVDLAALDKVIIGVAPGDGIGPIITEQAAKTLELLLSDKIKSGKIELRPIEGLTIERRLALGQAIPADTLAQIKACHVFLKGPTTTPNGGNMESANVALRRELDLYSNVRPVVIPEKGIDWTFFRENTEGEYVLGSKGVALDGALSMDFKVTTEAGTRRIARAAYEFARKNGKKRVSIITKANIMKKTDGMFSRVAHEVAALYPEIATDEWYIDIACANLLNAEIRTGFEVFLLPNLYGDIITDEAAQIAGGVGTAGSANTGDRYAMFEAIHGSAPRMVEQGIAEYANPTSILSASEMLLRHISEVAAAERLKTAIERTSAVEVGVGKATASDFGRRVREFIGN